MKGKEKERIAFLGTGSMGQPMARRLLSSGYPLVVYNRTTEKTEPLLRAGAEIASKPSEAILAASSVVVMLTDAEAIYQVLLSDKGRNALGGRTVIQMSTIGPWESEDIQKQTQMEGAEYVEAPVMGGPSHARDGK